MKTLVIVLLIAVIFAALFTGALLGVLAHINEEARPHCGNCTAWDRDLHICWWDAHECGKYAKGCVHHDRIETKENGYVPDEADGCYIGTAKPLKDTEDFD